MGWYENQIDFEERNLLNDKIKFFSTVSDVLLKLSKVVFQSANFAKENNLKIIYNKKLSSYPSVRDILIEADSLALDDPWEFSSLLKKAIDIIVSKQNELKDKRNELFNQDMSYKKKGWK